MPRLLTIAVVLTGLVSTTTARATAYYVYHEASSAVTGGECGVYRTPLTPTSSDAVTARFKVEYQYYTDEYRLYYTTDGTAPSGAMGTASGTAQAVEAFFTCLFDWDGHNIDVAEAQIPAQPHGTRVRYIVSAWHSGGGEEIFANSGTCDICSACSSAACATVFEYVVFDPDRDAGVRPDTAQPDTAEPDAGEPEGGEPDAAGRDRALSDMAPWDIPPRDVAAPDAAPSDTSPHDTAWPDLALPDIAPRDIARPDTSAPDTSPQRDAWAPDVEQADAAVPDTAGEPDVGACVAGCEDETHRIVCGENGQRFVFECYSGTKCQGGRCVSVEQTTAEPSEEGCGCSTARSQQHNVIIVFFMLTLALRRRRG